MEHIGKISNIVEFCPSRPTIGPEAVDKILYWHAIFEDVFNCRALSDPGLMAWVSTLGHCDKNIMDAVICDWIREETRSPKPADLLRKYREFRQDYRDSEKKKGPRMVDGVEVFDCPYCHDYGWFYTYYGKNAGDSYHSFVSKCECNPTSGNLGMALQDDRFRFDAQIFGFVIKNEWVGDMKYDTL